MLIFSPFLFLCWSLFCLVCFIYKKLVKLCIFFGSTNCGEKEKELMVEEYNSLKGRNDFLKAQVKMHLVS